MRKLRRHPKTGAMAGATFDRGIDMLRRSFCPVAASTRAKDLGMINAANQP